MIESLHKLTTPSLRDFAALCRQGAQRPTAAALQQLAGRDLGHEIDREIQALINAGWRVQQLSGVVEAIMHARQSSPLLHETVDLVVSGPDAPGVTTRDTAAVMHALFAEAQHEVLLVGYAVHKAQALFRPLAQRLLQNSALRVRCCLEIARQRTDTSLASEIVRRFALDFETKHWPWVPRPKVYYDPRSLEQGGSRRSSLHAKCIVVDRRIAFVTSANFTEAAQERNIECGVIVRDATLAARLESYFDALIVTRKLLECHFGDSA